MVANRVDGKDNRSGALPDFTPAINISCTTRQLSWPQKLLHLPRRPPPRHRAPRPRRVKQLTEIVERLKGRLTDINMESSTKELENVVRPWLAEVGVKDEDIQSMLEGAMAAQKRIIDAQIMPPDGAPIPPMERNNVIEVMCSAAARPQGAGARGRACRDCLAEAVDAGEQSIARD